LAPRGYRHSSCSSRISSSLDRGQRVADRIRTAIHLLGARSGEDSVVWRTRRPPVDVAVEGRRNDVGHQRPRTQADPRPRSPIGRLLRTRTRAPPTPCSHVAVMRSTAAPWSSTHPVVLRRRRARRACRPPPQTPTRRALAQTKRDRRSCISRPRSFVAVLTSGAQSTTARPSPSIGRTRWVQLPGSRLILTWQRSKLFRGSDEFRRTGRSEPRPTRKDRRCGRGS
jgi:hypothetical protein